MIYKTAMGIETGDTIIPSYSNIPRVVENITIPKYQHIDYWGNLFVREYPTFSVSGGGHSDRWVIADITRRDGNYYTSIYVTAKTVELTVIKPDKQPAMQYDMFTSDLDALIDEPYVFDSNIDYESQDPWRCSKCGLVFNAPPHDWNKAGTPCKNPDCNNTFVNSHVFIMALSNTNETIVRMNLGTRGSYGQVSK